MHDDGALATAHEDSDLDMEQHTRSQRMSLVSRYLALVVAWVATCGSLFFSEVLHWIPCSLCWYQRILMYPLSGVLAIGLLRRDRSVHTYVLPFSLAGAGVSLYHYLIQKTDWLPPPVCSIGVPCTVDSINWFGFITIPFLAFTAFVLISLLMSLSALFSPDPSDELDAAQPRFNAGQVAVAGIIGSIILSFVIAARFV
jgi:disulfide bond formation protein DsbB